MTALTTDDLRPGQTCPRCGGTIKTHRESMDPPEAADKCVISADDVEATGLSTLSADYVVVYHM